MSSVAEQCWAELFARLLASPSFGVVSSSIRRAHRVSVTRENAPAVYVIEGEIKVTEDKRCDWRWQMDGTIAVFTRDDVGSKAADPFVVEIVKRINPETGTPYSNRAMLDLLRIGPNTDIADSDATRIDIDIRFKFGTKRWTFDVAV